jgi:hypothetical protein
MRSSLSGALLCFVLLSPPLNAQQAGAASQSVQPILRQSFAALVGLSAVTDVTLTGTVRRVAGSDDETGSITLKALATGEARIDSSFPSGQRSEIRATLDSGPSGNWAGPDGSLHVAAQHNCWTDATWFFPAFLSAYSGSPSVQVTYVGAEAHNGAQSVHLRSTVVVPGDPKGNPSVFVAGLSQMDIFLDPQSYLPMAVDFNMHPDANGSSDIPVEIQYSNYQNISRKQVPLRVQEYIQNGLYLDISISSASFGTGLSSTEFALK